MPVKSFDVARVRGLYPTVGTGTAHLDGPFGALYPEAVVRAIIATLRSSPSQPGSHSARSQRAAASVLAARHAAADLVGGAPEDVVLGDSLGNLLLRLVGALSRDWQLGDELVLSRLDTDVNLGIWTRAARSAGALVRWAEVDLETGELPGWQYEELITRRTRVVAVPLGNAVTGTVPDVRAIADLAHRHGALVVVDAGAVLPHQPLDLAALGADLLAISAPSFGGPTVAAVTARAGLLAELDADPSHPQQFGPLPIELLDGFSAAIDHLAGLDESAGGTRRERLAVSLDASGSYTSWLYSQLDEGLRAARGVTVLGEPHPGRLPVVAFTVARYRPERVGDALARRGVSVWTGPSGLTQALSAFGADELGGAAFAGLMPHNNTSEVAQFVEAVHALI